MSTKTTYEVNGWWAHVEEDVWNKGCLPSRNTSKYGDEVFTHEDPNKLVEELARFCGTKLSEVVLDSCDEPGRVDVQLYETESGQVPSEKERNEWRAGRLRLFLVNYSFRVVRVTREQVRLTDCVSLQTRQQCAV